MGWFALDQSRRLGDNTASISGLLFDARQRTVRSVSNAPVSLKVRTVPGGFAHLGSLPVVGLAKVPLGACTPAERSTESFTRESCRNENTSPRSNCHSPSGSSLCTRCTKCSADVAAASAAFSDAPLVPLDAELPTSARMRLMCRTVTA